MSAMSLSQPPVSPEQIAPLPPEFRALLEAVIGHFEQRIAGLVAELATVKAELATTTAELAKAKAELAAAKRTPRNFRFRRAPNIRTPSRSGSARDPARSGEASRDIRNTLAL